MSRRGWLLFIALSVIWGMPYLFIRVAARHLSPAMLVSGRTLLAALVLLPVVLARGHLLPVLARWRWVLCFALIEIALPFGMLSAAEKRLSSSITGLLVAAVPLIGAGLGVALRLADRIDRRRLLGLLIGLAGVSGLVGIDLRGGDLLAAGAVGLAAVGYAIGPIIIAHRLADLPSLGVTMLAMAVTGLGYLPWAWATRPRSPVPAAAWGSVAVLGVLCSALAFLLFFALVAEVGPSRTTVITYLNPVVAIALGVTLLGEPVTVGMVTGFPLVLLGSWLATRASAPALPPTSPTPPAAPTPPTVPAVTAQPVPAAGAGVEPRGR